MENNKVPIAQAFVYKWTELSTLKWYIGSRTGRGCHPNDGYICSSSRVKPLILANPSNWKREVLFTKDCYSKSDQKEMVNLEFEILELFNAKDDPRSYNKSNGATGFSLAGAEFSDKHRAKLSTKGRGRPVTEETRSKIANTLKGFKASEETRLKLSKAGKGRTFSDTTRKKISALHKGRIISEEQKEKISITRAKNRIVSPEILAKLAAPKKSVFNKPCTVDGITIYESKLALRAALGCGKNGTRSPNFRFIVNGEVN